ncbi:hypothetical protein ACFW24_02845 [Streptomyces nigra]|uniref:glycoside hydrolase family 78 protein n=1 Tax=Streptomyces nigra TaxID=1827580 RepID=UPI0036CB9CE4
MPLLSAAGTASAAPAPAGPAGQAVGTGLRVVRTTVERKENVLGTDVPRPLLAWESEAAGHGARQTAYRVQVRAGGRDWGRRSLVWDSGKVTSANSVGVPYGGPALTPRTRYEWRVKVWDGEGRASAWSAPRWWETTMSPDEWGAHWIGVQTPRPPDLTGASWIWATGATSQNAPVGSRWFRARLELPAGTEVVSATVVATADDDFSLHLDGHRVLHVPQQQDAWRTGRTADVTREAGDAVRARAGTSCSPPWPPTARVRPSIRPDSSSG